MSDVLDEKLSLTKSLAMVNGSLCCKIAILCLNFKIYFKIINI